MNTLDINKIYELIDLYKYASIEGERVEIIVSPYEENGKWDDSKRIITIGLQGGFSRDRDSFIIDNVLEFERLVLPRILAYYTSDDKIEKIEINHSELENVTSKEVIETESGNLFYLESLDDGIFEKLEEEKDKVINNTNYKKIPFLNEDKIWEEIFYYVKQRRVEEDFYKDGKFTKDERKQLYSFIVNIIQNEKKLNSSNTPKYREKNEELLKEIFKDNEKLEKYGLNKELIEKIDDSDKKKLAKLARVEKRARRRLDFSNIEIQEKIKFAIEQLDRVDYFNLKNANYRQFDNGKFISSQPKAIQKLEEIVENEKEKNYCKEIYSFLEKKANNNRKVEKENINLEFIQIETTIIDSYEKLYETIELIKYGKLDSEHYEIILEDNPQNENERLLRISIMDGLSRTDSFNFKFTNKEKFDNDFCDILLDLEKDDHNFQSDISFVDIVEKGTIKNVLHETQSGNQILIKNATDNLAYLNKPKEIENEELKLENEKIELDEENKEKLRKIELEINKIAEEQDLFENKQVEQIDTTVSFEQMHEYVKMYEIANQKGLQVFYRDAGREYIPKNEEEKRNIEFAIYWTVGAGVDDNKEDVVVGEKCAFSNDSKILFNLMDVQFRESVKRNIPVDMESLERQFKESGIKNAEIVFERLFKNQYYVDYVTQYYQKSLYKKEIIENNKKETLLTGEKDSTYEKNNKDILDGALEQAKLIIRDQNNLFEVIEEKNENKELKEKNDERPLLLQKENEEIEIKNGAKEQAIMLQKNNEMADIKNGALEQAHLLQRKNEEIEIKDGAKEQARMLQKNNEMADIKNGALEQAKLLIKLRDSLFEVIKEQEEKKEENNNEKEETSLNLAPDEKEIKDAYGVSIEQSTADQPTSIKIFFSKEDKNEAELIISSGIGADETVLFQKNYNYEDLKTRILPILTKMYAKNNNVTYNKSFKVPNTDKGGLVVVGTDERTFQVSNANMDFVELCETDINDELNKNLNNEFEEKSL
ncbi:MAG: hypothetical protein IJ568_00945 [Bacilli bacterium]|nr:hypothetical protein [Bacilli bacterium]